MRNNKVREILELAVPATVESILQTLVGFIDTLMISRLGLLAVTAVGIRAISLPSIWRCLLLWGLVRPL
ncbi:MATE family efflux transporter [Proteiniclasticum sp. QWL-01]|uniref:MATE family efflux transporter n=1 Tax=Proteiniclasticum sp. QWL-01 TaxID=3036945 RepID=UPI00241100D8|nr:MATE family efflux transporter [Proteiniclasticum sp. QWL-01]WFF74380.1 MATE family efflux transporter [Proteiniclasticum sp. QWL-01]